MTTLFAVLPPRAVVVTAQVAGERGRAVDVTGLHAAASAGRRAAQARGSPWNWHVASRGNTGTNRRRPRRPGIATYNELLKRFEPTISSLGITLGEPVEVVLNKAKEKCDYDAPGSSCDAYTTIRSTKHNRHPHCVISFNPAAQDEYDENRWTWRLIVGHELFRCFEALLNGAAWQRKAAWIVDGEAEWVGVKLAGSGGVDPWWNDYLAHPEVPITTYRTNGYAGIGFYSHLAESGIDPWGELYAMQAAPSDAAAIDRAISLHKDRFLDTWASGFFRNSDVAQGRAWRIEGPAIPSGPRAKFAQITVANNHTVTEKAAAYQNEIFRLNSAADILDVQAGPHVRLSDGYTDRVLPTHSHDYFCARQPCECPSGQYFIGPALLSLGQHADLALTGGASGTNVKLSGIKLKDQCEPLDPCLFGTWNVNETAFLTSILPPYTTLDGISGTQTMTFNKTGTMDVKSDAYTADETFRDPPPSTFSRQLEVVVNGTGSATWSTPTKGTLTFTNFVTNMTETLTDKTFGKSSSGPVNGVLGSGAALYTCNGSTVDLSHSGGAAAPIVLERIGS